MVFATLLLESLIRIGIKNRTLITRIFLFNQRIEQNLDRIFLSHTESTEITELPVLWQYFTLRWNPRNCRLGLKPCDWMRGVSANGFTFTLRQPS